MIRNSPGAKYDMTATPMIPIPRVFLKQKLSPVATTIGVMVVMPIMPLPFSSLLA